jgi:excisionase family DNA binding protein
MGTSRWPGCYGGRQGQVNVPGQSGGPSRLVLSPRRALADRRRLLSQGRDGGSPPGGARPDENKAPPPLLPRGSRQSLARRVLCNDVIESCPPGPASWRSLDQSRTGIHSGARASRSGPAVACPACHRRAHRTLRQGGHGAMRRAGRKGQARDRARSSSPSAAPRTTGRVGPPLLVTLRQAAQRLRVHVTTIRAMIRRRALPAVRFGRTVRVYAPALAQARPLRRHR